MNFDEKLKTLRKNKNITQDELAKQLYVSRTAVSKWESGKGYPSIDTLKQLADFYDISLDELLSNEEMLSLSKNDIEKSKRQTMNLVYGLLDIFVCFLFFIPLFSKDLGNQIVSVNLFKSDYTIVKITLEIIGISLSVICGLVTLPFVVLDNKKFLKTSNFVSLGLSVFLATIFMITKEPYAGFFVLCLLAIKLIFLIKK